MQRHNPSFPPGSPLQALLDGPVAPGIVTWIGVRPARHAAMIEREQVALEADRGVAGDHYTGRGGRQVSLIGEEALAAIGSFLGRAGPASPALLRRNVVVRGVNLLALKGRAFRLGGALLRMGGECHPCSRMETLLGPGGYNAVRGHGGMLATVLVAGPVRRGDRLIRVEPAEAEPSAPGCD